MGWGLGLEKQIKNNYNETKINQCAEHEELLPQHTDRCVMLLMSTKDFMLSIFATFELHFDVSDNDSKSL